MTLDAIDPRYRRFVVAVEPELTPQQRRDIANSLKKPSTKAKFDKLTGPLTESDRQRIRARNRARKLARRAYTEAVGRGHAAWTRTHEPLVGLDLRA